ncbi:hypothetical protein RD055328_08340 [Companilactobacillus sp. RD055328]|uniref:tail assembly chaperone n=1 Tax=Companilactobacillus sp. RD055328 TaxID=2916634 RepID=UPI001FC8610A|nr:tail assembly chaperone [Companilactobacillus sp. RD055328]GKQ42911.1 hypothetical protein RD055328_08340 [Companilactobacillus sp. RD055328]
MKIKIDKKEYELNFGIDFLRDLDRIAGMEVKGVSMGMGLSRTLPALMAYDPLALINVLYCGTHACSPRPSMDEITSMFADETMDEDKINTLFEELNGELKKSPLVRISLNKITANSK